MPYRDFQDSWNYREELEKNPTYQAKQTYKLIELNCCQYWSWPICKIRVHRLADIPSATCGIKSVLLHHSHFLILKHQIKA